MNFVPYDDKIEVEPAQQTTVLSSEPALEEMGTVVAIGANVRFVKPGDTLFFVSHGCWKTPEVDGKRHYLVPETPEFILGKAEPEDIKITTYAP